MTNIQIHLIQMKNYRVIKILLSGHRFRPKRIVVAGVGAVGGFVIFLHL